MVVPPVRRLVGAGDGWPLQVPNKGSAAEEQVLQVLREALRRNAGLATPSRLQRSLFTALRNLLPPRSLKQFVHCCDEFEIVERPGSREWAFRYCQKVEDAGGEGCSGGGGVAAVAPVAVVGGADVSAAPPRACSGDEWGNEGWAGWWDDDGSSRAWCRGGWESWEAW